MNARNIMNFCKAFIGPTTQNSKVVRFDGGSCLDLFIIILHAVLLYSHGKLRV